jgi:hypothetical protein
VSLAIFLSIIFAWPAPEHLWNWFLALRLACTWSIPPASSIYLYECSHERSINFWPNFRPPVSARTW